MDIIVRMDIICLIIFVRTVVADYVDFTCIFVSGSGRDCCEFMWQKMSITKFQRPCWATWAPKNWEGIVVATWKRKVLPEI